MKLRRIAQVAIGGLAFAILAFACEAKSPYNDVILKSAEMSNTFKITGANTAPACHDIGAIVYREL